MANGTLYGVGLGPGDPKLMTIRAGEVVRSADVLAFPVNEAGESRARAIAAPIIEGHAAELPVHLPMRVEREPAQEAYDKAAEEIARHLDAGRSVAWLCVGDPLFYGSFIYIAARLATAHEIEIVPGVTSVSAGAAKAQTALAGRDDILTVIPATLPENELQQALNCGNAAAIIKVGRHFEKVRNILQGSGLAEKAWIIDGETAGDEKIMPLASLPEGGKPYFSTIFVRTGDIV